MDSGQKSFGKIGRLVPTEKMTNVNRKLRLEKREQTLRLHSQQRFSQHPINFILLWKISNLLLPTGEVCNGEKGPGAGQGALVSSTKLYPLTTCDLILRVPPPGCLWIGHIFPESRYPHSVNEADKVLGSAAACQLLAPDEAFVGSSTRKSWFLKGKKPCCINLCWPSTATKAICWKVYFKLKWKGNILNESSCLFQFSFFD